MKLTDYDEIVVHTCERFAWRHPALKAELERLGLSDCVVWQYNNESGHANMRETLARAVERGYNRVLCLEDDIRFLKDRAEVEAAFLGAPEKDYDICSFDSFIHLPINIAFLIRNSRPAKWVEYGNLEVYGTSCWSFGARAAKVLLNSYDAHPNEPPDSRFFVRHQDLKSAFLSKNACVQICYGDCMNVEKGWGYAHHVGYTFLNYADYNIPEGYGFGSVVMPPKKEGAAQ